MRALFGVWGYSSAGRALAWHARGQRFDPAYLHQTSSTRNGRPHRLSVFMSPSSRGLGHRPFTAITGVRIPVGTPVKPGVTGSGNPFSIAAPVARRHPATIHREFQLAP